MDFFSQDSCIAMCCPLSSAAIQDLNKLRIFFPNSCYCANTIDFGINEVKLKLWDYRKIAKEQEVIFKPEYLQLNPF